MYALNVSYSMYFSNQAPSRTPEDPDNPHRPVTSQIKINDKKGRRRMVKETKKKQGEEKKTPEWSPLRHSLPQNRTTWRLSSRTKTLQRYLGC